MLSTLAPILGLSDAARPILLIGFVLFMFVAAGLAVALGQRRLSRVQAKALSEDTGSNKGAMRGRDTTFDDGWLAETRAEVDESPKQSWTDLILGPGAVHDDEATSRQVVPPEILATQPAAADPWDAGSPASPWEQPTGEPEVPAYLQPENLDPAPHPAAPAASMSPVVPAAPLVPPPGKHRAAPPAAGAPFLVDDFLDDED